MIKTPLGALLGTADPSSQDNRDKLVRGVVESVNYYNDRDPSMLFNVRFTSGSITTGSPLNVVEDVPLLTPGFMNPSRTGVPATGFTFVPEVGSKVLLGNVDGMWVILGFFSGPVKTSDATDRELQGLSFNPGIEQAVSKVDKIIPAFATPWVFGLEPGDLVLGKDGMRVKLCKAGAVIGGIYGMSIYKDNGEILERCVEKEERRAGYMYSHRYLKGIASDAYLASPLTQPAPLDGAVVTTEVFECSPYPEAWVPFRIEQRGMILGDALNDARQSIQSDLTNFNAGNAGTTKLFTMVRDAIVQQVAKTLPDPAKAVGMELLTNHCLNYEHTQQSDGSWSIRSGNKAHAPAVPKLDFEMSYDALTQTFEINLGPAGAPMVGLSFNGLTGLASITSKTALTVKALAETTVESLAEVKVKAGVAAVSVTPAFISAAIGGNVHAWLTPASIDLAAPAVNINSPNTTVQGNLTVAGVMLASTVTNGQRAL